MNTTSFPYSPDICLTLTNTSLPFYNLVMKSYLATITSKRQLTIPAKLFSELGLEAGQKLVLVKEGRRVYLETANDQLAALAGSIKTPQHLRGANLDTMIRRAKKAYFGAKKI